MGSSFSRMITCFQSHTPTISNELKEHLKSIISGARFKNRSSELSLLNVKVEELDSKLSKKNEDFEKLFVELQREREFRESQSQQISDRDVQFRSENRELQEKNNKLLDQIQSLVEKERLEHSFQMAMAESQNKVLTQVERLNEHIVKPKSPSKIGEIGEDFVLNCLKSAFPNNTSIVRHSENNSGDILFRIENTEKYIMFEIKNYADKAVSSSNNGKDISKFFRDLNNPASNVPCHGGVLVSLNSPVDLNFPPLVPKFYLGKPYLYIDNMKQQYPDAECLMKVVVNMMTYLIKNSDHMEVESFGLKIENYQRSMKPLMQAYQRLCRNQETQKKNLDSLKDNLESLNNLFLCDLKEATELEKNGDQSSNKECLLNC